MKAPAKTARRILRLLVFAALLSVLPSRAAGAEDSSSVRIVAGPDWIPFAHEPWIEPGSALDFSSVVPHHAPAGKFGRVVARGGHFEFEGLPGVPQRFYGVNVCETANLPDTAEQAERFAANLARIGYNAIRFHHHERCMISEDGLAGGGTRPDPALQEKFDLLVAACVKHGIYLTTDLYVSRAGAVPWRVLGFDRDGTVPGSRYKILCAFHGPTFENLRSWTRNFLSHVNPHTGRSLADEPALACLALVNEGSLGNWGAAALRELDCVREAWKAWLSAKAGDPAFAGIPDTIPDRLLAPDGATPANRHAAAFAIFLADAETRLFERLRGFVRDELGCKAPLSSLSDWYEPLQYALPRKGFDYVDAHFYVDLPQFLGTSWQLPSRCPNANPMLGENRGVPGIVWRRQEDKPFCVTEFNYAGPGRFRGVGGIATGAIGALQDWSGLWRFAWSHSRIGVATPEKMAMGYFNLAGDPLSLAAERAALCLFLRGDAAPLDASAPLVLDEAALRDPRYGAPRLAPPGGNAGAWTRRVGTRVASAASRQSGAAPLSGPSPLSRAAPLSGPADLSQLTPEGGLGGEAALSPEGVLRPQRGHFIDNVAIDPETGTLLLDTPRTAGGFAESGELAAGPLRFALRDAPATVWVSSLDGEPVASSSHLLLTHLTDVQNSGIEYADPALTTLLKWGSLPHLMRRGAAEIGLRSSAADGCWRVYRLSPSGRRMGEVPSAFENGTLRFTARTDLDPATATFLYELVRDSRTAARPKVAVFGGSFSRIQPSQVAKRAWSRALGVEVADFGLGGTGFLAGAETRNDISNQIRRALGSNDRFRAFVLWASTNDIHDHTVEEQNAAIERCVETIRAESPDSVVLFFTSMPVPLNPEANAALGRFVQGQIVTCARLGVPCLDLYHLSGITADNAADLTGPDRFHPNEAGYEMVKDIQVEFLRNCL